MKSNCINKIATTLISPVLHNKDGAIEKVCSIIKETAENGAKLVVFPETYIPGYPWWLWMALNNNKKLELFKLQYVNSIELDSPEMDHIRSIAKKYEIIVALGYVEKDLGTLYNSQVLISEEGKILHNRRKLMPTGEERTIWGWGDATGLRVSNTSIGKIGMLICYEHSMALSRYSNYGLGEQIHIGMWPGANFKSQPRDRKKIIDCAMRNATFEGQVYVAYSSSCIGQEELDFYLELDPSNKGILEPGGGISGIVDPIGNYIAGPAEDNEAVIYAEIDLDNIINVKHMIDCVGHYSRGDVFQLNIFEHKHQPVKVIDYGYDHDTEKCNAVETEQNEINVISLPAQE